MGSAAPYASPNEAVPTADGWIMVAAYHDDRWPALCHLLGRDELATDARFHDNASRVANRAELLRILAASFGEKTTAEWQALLDAADILCGPIASYAEVVASPQYAHNNVTIEVEHPVAGTLRMPGFAIGDRDTASRVVRPPPLVGQHTTEVLREHGLPAHDIETLLAGRIVVQSNTH
jgi:crotonobetainyl-CoA:carnitine CoA-transferase CaiB-like acyl-CoA transferase